MSLAQFAGDVHLMADLTVVEVCVAVSYVIFKYQLCVHYGLS